MSAENDSNEYVKNYSQLIKAVRHRDWKEVEKFVSKNPDVLYTRLQEASGTLITFMVGYSDDEALRLMEKFLHKVSAEDLEKEETLFRAAAAGNAKAAKILLKFNQNLPNIPNKYGLYPISNAVFSGNRETIEYLLSVTHVEQSKPFAGGLLHLLSFPLIQYNLLDIALNLLKSHPEIFREDYGLRSLMLQELAKKPKVFASGSQLGFWKRLIYQYIPVQKERLQSPQTEKNDLGVPESGEGDAENPTRNSSTKTASGFLPKMATKFGALSQKFNIMFWNTLMQLVAAPYIKGIHDTKLMHNQSVEIVRMMCDGVEWNFRKASETLKMPVLMAAKLGICEIVSEILDVYSYSVSFVDEEGHTIHMLAVLHRQEEMFKILNQEQRPKTFFEKYSDKSSDTILHLAGRLVPSSEVAGAALQMQQELQWFKAVENCLRPSVQDKRNNENKTPKEVFVDEHKQLVKDGEKWMKDTAQSCTVVASLIITVVFAAAFTVSGGSNNEGIPNFLHNLPFIVFVTSDALALFSSTTSLLMFLGILTSRYSQEDFLVSLPRKFMIGLISMFFAIANMMVAFGATVYIVLSHPWKWVIIPVALLGCIPVTIFALLQFPLLVEMFSSTYRPSLLQPIKFGM